MKLQTYNKPAAFLTRVQDTLAVRETVNNLILGLSMRLCERQEWIGDPPYLATIEDNNGTLALISVMTPPHNLLLAADSEVEPSTFNLLIENLLANKFPVPGVMAESGLALLFAQSWEQVTGQPYRVRMRERVYELRQVIFPLPMPSGRLQTAGPQDLAQVLLWRAAFVEESLGEAPSPHLNAIVGHQVAAGDVFIWEDQGRPVSTAMRSRPTQHGYTITAVYTPPEQRGRGYASACIAVLSQSLLDGGKEFCSLFTDLDNPTSNAIYQKIGYRPVADFIDYKFG